MTTFTETSDAEPRFVGVAGLKPPEATAEGGLGLMPATPAQAKSSSGGDNLLGNDNNIVIRAGGITGAAMSQRRPL